MDLLKIYNCFCDLTRLRILHVLSSGPLCVCHFQEILGEPQVKISKHLGYLKTRGLVVSNRSGNWMVYSLPQKQTTELRKNLACLQDCTMDNSVFKKDADKLKKLSGGFKESSPICCSPKPKSSRKVTASL